MLALPLALLACGGPTTEPEPAPPAPAEQEVPPPAAPPPSSAGVSRRVELDAAGGLNGAPADAAFIVPAGVDATASMKAFDGGARGVSLEVRTAGDALVCTQPIPIGERLTFRTRVRLSSIQTGAASYDGLNLELRARGPAGELISPPTTRYLLISNLKQAGDWQEVEAEIAPPVGAVNGEFCARFVASTGVADVDWIEVLAPGVAAAPANAADVATVSVTEKRWELDATGGGNGAPVGFDFILPPTAPGVKATAGDVGGGAKGFRLEVTQAGNALACSEKFPVAGTQVLRARVKIEQVKADARAWTGFVTEVRTWDAAGALVSPPGAQYTTLDTARTAGDWREIEVSFAAPARAVEGRACVRFVESTGNAAVDWMAVGA
jgi:hypothetical protein